MEETMAKDTEIIFDEAVEEDDSMDVLRDILQSWSSPASKPIWYQ